jgi:hypothetical protein
MVPSEPLVSHAYFLCLLPALCFLGHPQPWSLRGCDGCFELVDPPWFGFPFPGQNAQYFGLGCMGSDQSAAGSPLALWGLDQKLLVLAQVTPGLFLGFLTPLSLVYRVSLALDMWLGVDWWLLGVATRVLVMTEGA